MQVYYPINTYSYNEMASFVGDIKRVVGPAPALASNGNSYVIEVTRQLDINCTTY